MMEVLPYYAFQKPVWILTIYWQPFCLFNNNNKKNDDDEKRSAIPEHKKKTVHSQEKEWARSKQKQTKPNIERFCTWFLMARWWFCVSIVYLIIDRFSSGLPSLFIDNKCKSYIFCFNNKSHCIYYTHTDMVSARAPNIASGPILNEWAHLHIWLFFDANQNKNINQIHKTINIGQICIWIQIWCTIKKL